jgi:lysophospholipase L1-like esterase
MLKLAFAAALLAIPDDMPIPVNVGGRVTQDMRFGWPGIYFEGRFTGTDVIVEVESGTEHLRVLVDGAERAVLTKPGRVRLQITGLAAGAHVVRLEKLTESQSGGGRFLGFFTRAGQPLPLQRRVRQIEFIGDSHSVGYGDTSTRRECPGTQVHDTTDTQQAFGPVLARRLDADYRVIAYSGYGVVRNYAGGKPGESLPFLYDRAIPGEPAPAAADPAWRPQTIVINLGTNDFSTPLKPGETWADAAALRADYRAKYVAFVRRLRAMQPQARIVLMAADAFRAEVEQVAAATGATVVDAGPLELTGCDWHPSLKDQRAMADRLQAALAR